MTLAGPKINVPEFHDCQRFIVSTDTGPVYDSLFAIFAASGLDTLDTTLNQLDSAHQGTVALAAAEVYAEGIYLQLGIRSMFSCLYVYRDSIWRAKMVPEGKAEHDCNQAVNPNLLGGPGLEVHRTMYKGFEDRDYPPVARWDWDSTHSWQTIGLKCGRAWCEAGPPGFATSSPPDIPFLSQKPKQRRIRMIKGWFDQQYLAQVSSAGSVKPSKIWGTIWPDSGLDDYDTTRAFTRGRWRRVAQVALEDRSGTLGSPNPYKASLNLDLTGPNGPFNTIYLCHGTKSQCRPDLLSPCDGDGQWWGLVVAASDTAQRRYKCTVRRPHDALGYRVPGSARWRWLASDETTWKRCDAGCCELH